MIKTQQLVPQQQAVVGSQISDMLDSIMQLVMLMMVFMMITPMMKGMGEAFN
jgi:hypothetical protein